MLSNNEKRRRERSVGCDDGRFISPTFRSLAVGKSKGVLLATLTPTREERRHWHKPWLLAIGSCRLKVIGLYIKLSRFVITLSCKKLTTHKDFLLLRPKGPMCLHPWTLRSRWYMTRSDYAYDYRNCTQVMKTKIGHPQGMPLH